MCVWTYAKFLCILFVSSTSGIVFNPRAGATITDDSQSVKDRNPYSLALCGGPRTPKAGTHLPNGLSKPRELAHDEINFFRGWDSNPQPVDYRVYWTNMHHLSLPFNVSGLHHHGSTLYAGEQRSRLGLWRKTIGKLAQLRRSGNGEFSLTFSVVFFKQHTVTTGSQQLVVVRILRHCGVKK